mmetsp:Transcript_121465/g.388520  ORF Transcript_121465/g.388520 Transcript_121465/m.388520 type:complete len:297 (+) Transcript_121465:1077-1967(+)
MHAITNSKIFKKLLRSDTISAGIRIHEMGQGVESLAQSPMIPSELTFACIIDLLQPGPEGNPRRDSAGRQAGKRLMDPKAVLPLNPQKVALRPHSPSHGDIASPQQPVRAAPDRNVAFVGLNGLQGYRPNALHILRASKFQEELQSKATVRLHERIVKVGPHCLQHLLGPACEHDLLGRALVCQPPECQGGVVQNDAVARMQLHHLVDLQKHPTTGQGRSILTALNCCGPDHTKSSPSHINVPRVAYQAIHNWTMHLEFDAELLGGQRVSPQPLAEFLQDLCSDLGVQVALLKNQR